MPSHWNGSSMMWMIDNSPLTRRSVKQRSVGSTHIMMPSTAVTDAPHNKIISCTMWRVNKISDKQSLSQLRWQLPLHKGAFYFHNVSLLSQSPPCVKGGNKGASLSGGIVKLRYTRYKKASSLRRGVSFNKQRVEHFAQPFCFYLIPKFSII